MRSSKSNWRAALTYEWHMLLPSPTQSTVFPRMSPREALVFKVYDSAEDGRARFTAHSAFALPDAPPDAPPRQSVEVRMFVLF